MMCRTIAAFFFYAGASRAPVIFLVVFCGMFAFGGLSIVLYLPRHAKGVWKDDGAHVIVANGAGITLTLNLGSRSLHYPWTKLSEVIVAKWLTLVDTNETTSLKRPVIVMLSPDAYRHGQWINELGSGTRKSGEGRVFLSGEYPAESREELVRKLQELMPISLPIRVLADVTFDRQSQRDIYTET